MTGRLIEVATDGVHLFVERGFLSLKQNGERMGQVPLDDIGGLIVHGHGATFSANLMARLAERGVPMVICGPNHVPVSVVWPVDGHHAQGTRMEAQAAASLPLRKRLWRDLVRAKIAAQADALAAFGERDGALRDLARRVRAGDPENIEAQAARRYWQRMMGPDFRRDRSADGVNALLNYAYMVLRAAAARSIVGAGLHPSLSLHHSSRGSALRLADDVMEPFRPYCDIAVRALVDGGATEVDRVAKAALSSITTLDLEGPFGAAPLQTCLDRLCVSLAQVFLGERRKLELPGPALPLAARQTDAAS